MGKRCVDAQRYWIEYLAFIRDFQQKMRCREIRQVTLPTSLLAKGKRTWQAETLRFLKDSRLFSNLAIAMSAPGD